MSTHVEERLSAYLDGELPAVERQTIDAHLRVCASCARHLEHLARVDEMARALPLEPPAGYFESLPGRVRFKLTPRPRRTLGLPTWSWAVAAALLLAVIAPRVLEHQPSPGPVATRESREAPVPRLAPPAPPASAPSASAPGGPGLGEARGGAPAARKVPERSALSSPDDRAAGEKADFAAPPATPTTTPAPPPVEQERAPRAERFAEVTAVDPAVASAARPQAPAPAPASPEGRRAGPPYAAPPEEGKPEGAAAQQLPETYEQEKDVAEAVPSTGELEKGEPGRMAAALADADTRKKLPRASLYRSLIALSPTDAAEARRARERWREFVALHPLAPEADEARVRIVEMGDKAWRFSNDPADLVLLRQDAEAYLRRDDAAQGDRVRRLLHTTGY